MVAGVSTEEIGGEREPGALTREGGVGLVWSGSVFNSNTSPVVGVGKKKEIGCNHETKCFSEMIKITEKYYTTKFPTCFP